MMWLIRHGESESNAGAAVADYAAMALTPRGQAEAERVAAACPHRPDLVIVSPYRRAQLTAAPTLARFPDLKAQERPVQEFTYLTPERCRGTTPATRDPLVVEYWRRMDPTYVDGAGAESFAALALRVRAFLAEARGWPGMTLVFTHAQFIRATAHALLVGAFEGTKEDMVRCHALRTALPVPNGAYFPVEWRAGVPWLGGLATEHLRGLDPA
jgi:broad specificity phosphatase PhoE